MRCKRPSLHSVLSFCFRKVSRLHDGSRITEKEMTSMSSHMVVLLVVFAMKLDMHACEEPYAVNNGENPTVTWTNDKLNAMRGGESQLYNFQYRQ